MKKFSPLVALIALLVLTGCGEPTAPQLASEQEYELRVPRKVDVYLMTETYTDKAMAQHYAEEACEAEPE